MGTTTMAERHRIRWYGVVSGDELVPRNRRMNGRDWGWEAKCSCGWESRTGGAIEAEVRRKIADHRWDVDNDAVTP